MTGLTLADILQDAGYPGVAEDIRNGATVDGLLQAAREADKILAQGNRKMVEIVEAWMAGEAVA